MRPAGRNGGVGVTVNVIKGLHILAVIAWMAGLLYLPRLFAYHTRSTPGGEAEGIFKIMEQKLITIIMTPAMIAVVILGATLVWFDGLGTLSRPWMLVKLLGVAGLIAWHVFLEASRRRLATGERPHSERFWRMTNELPFLVAIVIVLSVTTKFGG
jgi:putative membrane protein